MAIVGAVAGGHDQSAVQNPLRMPMVASQFGTLAERAIREKQSHIGYLEALLLAEIEERERNTIERRIRKLICREIKTLEEFDYTQSPNVTAAKMRDLAEGGYIDRAEPVLFIGECGTGKTHLLTGLTTRLRASRSVGYDLPPRPVWSTNWWRLSIGYSFGA